MNNPHPKKKTPASFNFKLVFFILIRLRTLTLPKAPKRFYAEIGVKSCIQAEFNVIFQGC